MIPSNYTRIPQQPTYMGSQIVPPNLELNRVAVSSKKLENINCIFSPSDAIGGLFLGDVVSTLKQDLLKKHNIRAILTCMCERVSINPIVNCHKMLPIKDILEYPIIQHFDDAVAWIEQKRKQKYNVLVHCHAGVSRSATIIIAYLIRTKNWNPFQAFEFVKQQRERAKPNASFWNQINEYYNYWSKFAGKLPNQQPLIPNQSPLNAKSQNIAVVHQPHKMASQQILPKRVQLQQEIKKQEKALEKPIEPLHNPNTTNQAAQKTIEKKKDQKQKVSISRRKKIFEKPNFCKDLPQKTRTEQIIADYYLSPSMMNSAVKPHMNSHVHQNSMLMQQSRFSQNKSVLQPRTSMHSQSLLKSRHEQPLILGGRSSIQPETSQVRPQMQNSYLSPFQVRTLIRYP